MSAIPPRDLPVRLAVFDCDGTLVDGQGDICAAMLSAFALHGLPAPDLHQVRRSVGLSLPRAIATLLPGHDAAAIADLVDSYKSAFRAARAEGRLSEPLYPGIPEALAQLAANGWDLAVATGKSRRGLDHCLANHNLTHRFRSLHTADEHPSKPDPAMLHAALAAALAPPHAAVMIGDTAYDIAMAHAAGVTAIGVAWGYHTPAELRAAGAHAVAQSPQDLVALLA